jgi:hypothetical protein
MINLTPSTRKDARRSRVSSGFGKRSVGLMVEKVSKVSSATASAATRIDTGISLAEPDIARVAKRQPRSTATTPHLARNGQLMTMGAQKKTRRATGKVRTARLSPWKSFPVKAEGSAPATSMTMMFPSAATPASYKPAQSQRTGDLDRRSVWMGKPKYSDWRFETS